jgi:glycosyltransferase involved in cell wall biosynthesis
MNEYKFDISVVVPTLNEEKNIVSCLEALRNQTFSGTYEIIVADGPSTDKTKERAKKLADKIVSEKQKGIARERQAGANVAEGKIIAFTDADSQAPGDWLEKIKKAFDSDETLSMIYGPVFYSDVSKKEQWLSTFFMPKFLKTLDFFDMHNPIGSNIAIRKRVFETIGGFNTDYITCEDLDLGKRAVKHGPLRYVKNVQMYVSARKVKKWGYAKYIGFHLVNGVRYHITGKAARHYEDVRD